jgi:DNA segregation ATPase FtsK/SpoIIIE-like protein
MKATAKIFIFFLAVNSVTLMVPQKAAGQISINFQVFYDDLSPYGYWIDTPEYGYAWVPNVSASFIPYRTNGYWVYTNVGWTWVSNYPWGWAPFHYGRWYYDPYYEWIWIPGYEWGPGWVIWRKSVGYYGWAPIGPGISITVAYSNRYRLPYNYWTCVRDRDFGRTNIYNYYVPASNNVTIINNSTVINNIQRDYSNQVRYYSGPDRTEVQSRTGKTISPVTLKERNKPGQNLSNRELQIYRPRVEKRRAAERELAPSKVLRSKDVKPARQRTQQKRETQPLRQQHNDKQLQRQNDDRPTSQQQRMQQEAKEQQARQQRMQQEAKEQQVRQQRMQQEAKEQQARQQRMQQEAKEQQARQQRMQQEAKEQQARQQRMQQEAKEQQARQQRIQQENKKQQNRPQQMQQQRNDQQTKKQKGNNK